MRLYFIIKELTNYSIMTDSKIPSVNSPSLLWPVVAVLAVPLYFGFSFTGGERLDLWFQNFFWLGKSWIIPHDSFWGNVLAYDGIKACLILFALFLIFVALWPARAPQWLNRRKALYIFACMALVSIVSTQLRAVSGMTTPSDTVLYGGQYPHLLLFDLKPAGYPSRAFPAGHASGGFALICLYWAWANQPYRRWGLVIGLGLGSWMGLYQIARGEHFLSHTLATAALAWLICTILARWIKPTA
jgi:membrane-associated PAP2 superfamily phosphatase